jgi:hypothetical protein
MKLRRLQADPPWWTKTSSDQKMCVLVHKAGIWFCQDHGKSVWVHTSAIGFVDKVNEVAWRPYDEDTTGEP